MLSRENVTREVLSEMENQRARNLTEEKRRRDEAEKKSPVIAELLAQRQRLLFSGMRQAFASPASAAKISASMKTQMEQMNEKLRVELKNCGFTEDYLQPVYRCPLCKDTGYVGEPVHEQCACLKRAVLNRLYDNDGLQGLKAQNFETFREDIFPDVPLEGKKGTQRAYIRKIRQICEQYAEQVQDILTCDLLAIDDLGSEPMMRSVTVGSIYHVVSERHNAMRPMVISTNCSVQQLYEKYEDRIAARLCDQGRMTILGFVGDDVRKYAYR